MSPHTHSTHTHTPHTYIHSTHTHTHTLHTHTHTLHTQTHTPHTYIHTPHTHRYDVPSAIPDGSIQRAGENVVAILREVATSEQLANPSEEDTHGKVRDNGLSKIAIQTAEIWEKRSLLFIEIATF